MLTLEDIVCYKCKVQMEPVWFKQRRPDGMERLVLDYLICPFCLSIQCVDDSFDGEWYKPSH